MFGPENVNTACKFVARSSTDPSFLICTGNPEIGYGVNFNLHRKGMWEEKTYNAIESGLESGEVCKSSSGPQFVDFGANIGVFTLYAAATGCEVLAVDGQIDFLAQINKSLSMNRFPGKVTLRRFYLADTDVGTVDYDYASLRSQDVPVRTIDTVLGAAMGHARQIPVVKMDIEESVAVALQGARETFRRHLVRTWLVELWPSVDVAWLIENVVMQGYGGYFVSCELRGGQRDPCSWRGKDASGFRAAWSTVWRPPLQRNLADAVFVSDRSMPLLTPESSAIAR